MLAQVGDDEDGSNYIEFMRAEDIATENVR